MRYRLFIIAGLTAIIALLAERTSALSLDEAIERAQRDNELLRAAAKSVDAARGQILESKSGFLPSVRLSEQVVRSDEAVSAFGFRLNQGEFRAADFAVDRLNRPGARSNYQTRVEVLQPLFSGGRALHDYRQARAGVRLAEAALDQERAEIRLHTAVAYWDLVLAHAALETARESAAFARADAEGVKARYAQGMALDAERLAAQIRALDADVQTRTSADGIAEASEALSLVMGRAVADAIEPTSELCGRASVPPVGDLVERALRLRADVQVAEHGLEMARHGMGKARAAFWPQLNAFASGAMQTDAPLERQGTSWTVGAVVSWDLPAAATIGRMRRAAADRARLQSQRAFLRASIERQVYAAHRNIEAATARAEVRKEVVELARERRRIAQLQYGEQIVTATELLDAGTALAEARLSQLQAERDACVAWAKLEWATGGVLERQTGELK